MTTYKFLGADVMTDVRIEVEDDEGIGETVSKKIKRFGGAIHQLRYGFFLESVDDETAMRLMAHRGRYGNGLPFTWEGAPQHVGFAAPVGAVTLNGAHLKDRTNLAVAGNLATKIQDDSFFTLPGDAKVYEVVAGRQGAGAIEIQPGLQQNHPAGAALRFAPLVPRLRYDMDRMVDWRRGIEANPRVELVEFL